MGEGKFDNFLNEPIALSTYRPIAIINICSHSIFTLYFYYEKDFYVIGIYILGNYRICDGYEIGKFLYGKRTDSARL